MNNLAAAFGLTEKKELYAVSKRIFQNFSICFTDFCRFTDLDKKHMDDNIIAVSCIHKIHESMTNNKGVMIVTAHLGHWELGAIFLALHGHKTNVVFYQYNDMQIAHFFNRIRHPAIHWIEAEGGLRGSLRAMKKNEILATAVDINYYKGGLPVTFFGKNKMFPTGPALIAIHTGAPILTAYVVLDASRKKYITHVDKPIFANPQVGKDEELLRITQAIASNLEKNIRLYPDQWFIFQNFRED